MGKVLTFLLVLAIVLFGLSFALLNPQSVTIDYYFGAREARLSLALVVALIIGVMLGILTAAGVMLRQRSELGRLRRKNQRAHRELEELRRLPINENL